MKRVALITAIVLLVLSFLVILWQLQSIIFIFLVALVLAITVEQPIDRLTARGAPRWLAVLTLYTGVFAGLAAIAAFIFTPLTNEIDPFVQELLNQYGLLENRLAQLTDTRRGILIASLPATQDVAAMIVANPATGIGEGITAGAQRLLGMAGEAALALIIAIYWSMDSTRFERLWLSLLPPVRRTRARHFLDRLERNVGAYVRSELLQTLLAGALLTALYAIIGVDYPFLLATLVALTWLAPIYGGALALLFAAGIGSFDGWPTVLLATGATLLVLAMMEFIVQPRLIRERRTWGILVILLMLALVDAFGLIGLLLAPPFALIAQMVIDAILDRDQAFVDAPDAEPLAAVRTELELLKLRLAEEPESHTAQVNDLAGRLERLLAEAEETARQ